MKTRTSDGSQGGNIIGRAKASQERPRACDRKAKDSFDQCPLERRAKSAGEHKQLNTLTCPALPTSDVFPVLLFLILRTDDKCIDSNHLE